MRPEDCRLGEAPETNLWAGRVIASQFLGPDQAIVVEVAPGVTIRVRRRAGPAAVTPGASVHVHVPAECIWPIPERDPEGAADAAS